MDSERWQNVERLYHAAMECEESQRAAFLTGACGGDDALRREVESLVSCGGRSGRFIEGSALEVVAQVLAADEGDGYDPAADEDRIVREMIGKRISQYRIVEQLGRGGMGEVYRAVRADGHYQKQVAIKLVRAGRDSGSVIGRFKNERQILASLDHLNISRLLDGGATEEGVPYFVMELVEGQPIDEYCDAHRLAISARLKIFLQVCSALQYAHQHHIIHRDIKPSNILVSEEGVPKLLDFGIAKILASEALPRVGGAVELTQTFRVFTLKYASPEQIKGEPITAASDGYSLGVLLYELLTGHRPYRLKTRTPAEIEQAICEEEPLKPSTVVTRAEEQTLADGTTTTITPEEISQARDSDPQQMHSRLLGDLDAIVMMALRKEPHRRYASVDDFSEDIRRHLEGLPITARPSTIVYRGTKFVRRHKELAVGTLILLVLLGGLAIVAMRIGLWQQWYASKPKLDQQKDTILLADFANYTGDSVFDSALRQGLAADLGQSPFLNILPDRAITRQLENMGLPRETRLTTEVAREACRREKGKAMLLGSISSIGSRYAITLKAVDCGSEETLDAEQAEAERREDVLRKLHEMASNMRRKLGESPDSVQKYDTPLQQATTPSLEALQAYSKAGKTWLSHGEAEAVPLFKQALEIDPTFAVAWADLGITYFNLGEAGLSAEYGKRAYELRQRVTEKERFYIDSNYYMNVTGELEKAAAVFKEWKQVYPRELGPYINYGSVASKLGWLEEALANDRGALQLRKDSFFAYRALSDDYLNLNRLDDAKDILDGARAHKEMDLPLLPYFYRLAFLREDAKEKERCLSAATASGQPLIESALLSSQADTEAFQGHLKKARELSRGAIAAALLAEEKEGAANWQVTQALREAEFGNTSQARQDAKAALALVKSKNIQVAAALAFARTGDLATAQAMAADLQERFPTDTLLTKYWLPSIRAAIAISRKNADQAIGYLQAASPYELGEGRPPFSSGGTLYPAYLRGQAYLETKQWQAAAGEFRKILEHRGLVWNFPLGALANLQLGRAYAASDDLVAARLFYQAFLTRWHDSDPDVPILRQAKAEYAKLQ